MNKLLKSTKKIKLANMYDDFINDLASGCYSNSKIVLTVAKELGNVELIGEDKAHTFELTKKPNSKADALVTTWLFVDEIDNNTGAKFYGVRIKIEVEDLHTKLRTIKNLDVDSILDPDRAKIISQLQLILEYETGDSFSSLQTDLLLFEDDNILETEVKLYLSKL